MKKIASLLLLISVLLMNQCKRNIIIVEEVNVDTPGATEVITFTFEKEVEILDLSYTRLRVINGDIWVYGWVSGQKRRIDIFDKSLALKESKYLNYGQGPGDVGAAAFIFEGGGDIYVSDHTQFRVTVFDKDFKYKRMVKTPKSLVCISADKDFKHVLFKKSERHKEWTRFTDHYYLADFPGLKMTEYNSFGPFTEYHEEKDGPKFYLSENQYFHYFIHKATIYFLDASRYEIMTFDLDGNLQKRIKAKFQPLPMPEDEKIIKEWVSDQNGGNSRNLIELGDKIVPTSYMIKMRHGFIVIRRTGWSIGCAGTVRSDYFDYNLNFKGKVSVPCSYRIFFRRNVFFPYSYQYYDGYYYVVQQRGDGFILQKYKVLENQSLEASGKKDLGE